MTKLVSRVILKFSAIPKNLVKHLRASSLSAADILLISKYFAELRTCKELVAKDIYEETLSNLELHIIEQLGTKVTPKVSDILKELGTAKEVFSEYFESTTLSSIYLIRRSIARFTWNVSIVVCYALALVAVFSAVYGMYEIATELLYGGISYQGASETLRRFFIPMMALMLSLLLSAFAFVGIKSTKPVLPVLLSGMGLLVIIFAALMLKFGRSFITAYLDTTRLNQTITLTVPKNESKSIALSLPDANTSITIIEEDQANFNTPNDIIIEATTYQQQSPSWTKLGVRSRVSPMQEDLWIEGKLVTYYYWNTDYEYVQSLDGWYNLPVTDLIIRVPRDNFSYKIEGVDTNKTFIPSATWFMDATNKVDIRESIYFKNVLQSNVARGRKVSDLGMTIGNEVTQEYKIVGIQVDGPMLLTLNNKSK